MKQTNKDFMAVQKNAANFEVFVWNISMSTILLLLKSDLPSMTTQVNGWVLWFFIYEKLLPFTLLEFSQLSKSVLANVVPMHSLR